MKNLFFLTIALASFNFVTSCSPDEDVVIQNKLPNDGIEIISPRDGQQVDHGDELPIKVNIALEQDIHGYEWTIADLNGVVIAEGDDHIHGKTVAISETWTNTNMDHGKLVFSLKIFTDHDGGSITKTVEFHAHGSGEMHND